MRTIISVTVALRSGFRNLSAAVSLVLVALIFILVPVVVRLNSVELEKMVETLIRVLPWQ